ncbi:MAG: cyclopropane-fatty-acyl-phospholipid synthase family protein [Shewanella sp.]|nr:cyclopropane-fatty-acyl-phospholipid synthase family protein [Shewanella sp.]MCF1429879.1 cyclopropane-fatty-acyl-phospholipid synthase family protein [Shewanella sp.]MCF1438901.1 cyclopropane-fatty-acyl-phospholipid synthase family protein [Shewanella sp.]MCF1457798.1 cyclopropane-fatty-acyl-phospholipid synthase family protein [Shewanella sp.]
METTATRIDKKMSWTDEQARRLLLSALGKLATGGLMIREHSGEHWFGDKHSHWQAEIEVHDGCFYRQVLVGGSIGAAESYIAGGWDTPDLTAVIRLFAANMSLLDDIERRFGWLTGPLNRLGHLLRRNTREGSKRNILAHYDLGNALYQQFLDKEMLYSSAIYPRADMSLAQAQQHKMQTICERLDLQPGQTLLEVGTGWGALAIYAAKHYDVRVTTTTISDAQYEYARARVEAEGLSDRITLLKQDYRLLQGQYDRLVSIEMIEAVGHEYLPGFFAKLSSLVKADGCMLLQAITIADQRYDSYRKGVDFIQKYIFPGGSLPSVSQMTLQMTRHSDMVLMQLDDIGMDYAKTLAHWRENFEASLRAIRALGYGEDFIRMWRFYLCYCEGGFLERTTGTVHFVAAKPGYRPVIAQ